MTPATVTLAAGRLVVRGDTYTHRDALKAVGGCRAEWEGPLLARRFAGWSFPATEAAAEGVDRALGENATWDDGSSSLLRSAEAGAAAEARKVEDDPEPIPLTKIKPWLHQVRAYNYARDKVAAMLAMDMRTGKSKVVVDLVCNQGMRRVLVLCPLSVVDVWPEQFAVHGARPVTVLALGRGDGVKEKERELRTRLRATPGTLVVVLNYESAWREPMRGALLAQEWDLVVLDECFPEGTMISTPRGRIPIEWLQEGDVVYGVDHTTGLLVETRIMHTFNRLHIGSMANVGRTEMTPEHPVWSLEHGYLSVSDLMLEERVTVCYIEEDGRLNAEDEAVPAHLRMVRRVVHGGQVGSTFLREIVLWEKPSDAGDEGAVSPLHERDQKSSRGAGEAQGAPRLRLQPLPVRRCPSEGRSSSQEEGLRHAQRRERTSVAGAATALGDEPRLENRVRDHDLSETEGIPDVLQGGHRRASAQDSRGGRRGEPQGAQGAQARQEEAGNARVDGVARAEVPQWRRVSALERRRRLRGGRSARALIVYNLETETGNFFAEGLLVHNSHRIKSWMGRSSRFCAELTPRARRRICLTGTPMPHDPLDAAAQYRFLDPGIFGTSITRLRARYCVMGGFHNHEVKDWKNLDEFHALFYSRAYRVKATDVIDMPEVQHIVRRVELGPEERRVYAALESELMALVASGMVTVSNALVKLLRLEQCTSGVATLDDKREVRIGTAKMDALSDWMEDLDKHEPIVVFAHFVQDIEAIVTAARKLDRMAGMVRGGHSDLKAWQAGDLDVLAVQIHTGSEGQDMTRAHFGAYYSINFNRADYEQSEARFLGHKQEHPVAFYHFVVPGSIDEHLYQALAEKRDLVEGVLRRVGGGRMAGGAAELPDRAAHGGCGGADHVPRG